MTPSALTLLTAYGNGNPFPMRPQRWPISTAALAVRMIKNRYETRRVIDEIHKYRSWDLSKGSWPNVKGRVLARVEQATRTHTTHTHTTRGQTGPAH